MCVEGVQDMWPRVQVGGGRLEIILETTDRATKERIVWRTMINYVLKGLGRKNKKKQ